MVSINLSEINSKEQIAKIIRANMEINGIKKSELISLKQFTNSFLYDIIYLY